MFLAATSGSHRNQEGAPVSDSSLGSSASRVCVCQQAFKFFDTPTHDRHKAGRGASGSDKDNCDESSDFPEKEENKLPSLPQKLLNLEIWNTYTQASICSLIDTPEKCGLLAIFPAIWTFPCDHFEVLPVPSILLQ